MTIKAFLRAAEIKFKISRVPVLIGNKVLVAGCLSLSEDRDAAPLPP